MKCSQCGTELMAIAGACWKCGQVIEQVEASPSARDVGPGPETRSTVAEPASSAGGWNAAPTSELASDAPAAVGRVLPSNRGRFAPAPGQAAVPSGATGRVAPLEDVVAPTVGSMYLRAFRTVGRGVGVLVVGGVLAFAADVAVTWTLSRVLDYLGQGDQSPAGTLANAVAFLLVGAPLSVGWQYLCLRAIRNDSPVVGDVFAAYRGRLFDTAMASFVQGILVALSAVPLLVGFAAVVMAGVVPASVQTMPELEAALVALPTGTKAGILVGFLAGLVPPLVVAARLSFMPYVVIDEREGPLVAAAESWARSRGVTGTIIGVVLSGALLAVVGVLAFVVGAGVGMMFFSLAHAATFETVTALAARARVAGRSIDVYG